MKKLTPVIPGGKTPAAAPSRKLSTTGDSAKITSSFDKHNAESRLEARNKLPSDRFLGAHHPIEFIQDIELFARTYKRQPGRRAVPKCEMIELAFYKMRKELTGEEIPDWVVRLN